MPNLSKLGFPDKVAGDTLTAAELNEIKSKFNLLVDFINGTTVTPPIEVPTTQQGTYVIIAEGTSRVADERPRPTGANGGAYVGTVNPWFTRMKTAYAGNSAYIKFDNWSTAGDDISTNGMLHPIETNEIESSLVAGKVNILYLHHYINNLHQDTAKGPAQAAADCIQRIQQHMTLIKSIAQAKGAELRVVMFTEPSSKPPSFSQQQNINVEDSLVIVRTWLLDNYQSIGVLVLCDLASDSRFIGFGTPDISPLYADSVHYSPIGNQFICDMFAIPALIKASANTAGIITSSYVQPNTNSPIVLTTYNDDLNNTYTGCQVASISTGTSNEYSDNTTRFSIQGGTVLTLSRTANFGGTLDEYIEPYVYLDPTHQVFYKIDNGEYISVPNFGGTLSTPMKKVNGIPEGTHTITFKITGNPITYGGCNIDRWVVASRVANIAPTSPNSIILNTEVINDDSSLITYTGFEATSIPTDTNDGYSNNTTRLTIQGGTVATVSIPLTVTGTPNERLEFFATTSNVNIRYKINNNNWIDVGTSAILSTPFLTVKALASGSYTVTVEFSGSPLGYGSCNFDQIKRYTA